MGKEKIKEKINPYLKLSVPGTESLFAAANQCTNHRHW